MPQRDGTEPIADDELLYRRIPASQGWYDPTQQNPLSSEAFRPNKERDAAGISLWRSTYTSTSEAAAGQPGKTYYVAVLRMGDLRARGVEVVPDVDPNDPARSPGHAVIPTLNSANRRSVEATQLKKLLAEVLTLRVDGPFETPRLSATT